MGTLHLSRALQVGSYDLYTSENATSWEFKKHNITEVHQKHRLALAPQMRLHK